MISGDRAKEHRHRATRRAAARQQQRRANPTSIDFISFFFIAEETLLFHLSVFSLSSLE